MAVISPVPTRPGYPIKEEIISAAPVRASTWTAASNSLLNSMGSTNIFVPWHSPQVTVTGGATKTLRFRYTPNGRATQIRWVYQVEFVSVNDVGVFQETIVALGSKSSSIQTIDFTYTNSNFSTVRLVGLIGYEDTNSAIEDIDLGVRPATYQIREPITGIANESIGGLFEGATAKFRRYYLNHSDEDTTSTHWSSSVTTGKFIIKEGIILTRRQVPTSQYCPTQWHVRAALGNINFGGMLTVINNKPANPIVNHLAFPIASFPLVNTFYNFTMPRAFTWSKAASATATLTRTAHRFTTMEYIYVDTTTNSTELPIGVYQVTSTGANTITINTGVVGTATGSCTNDLEFDCEDYNDNSGMPLTIEQFYDVIFKVDNIATTLYISNIACEEVI